MGGSHLISTSEFDTTKTAKLSGGLGKRSRFDWKQSIMVLVCYNETWKEKKKWPKVNKSAITITINYEFSCEHHIPVIHKRRIFANLTAHHGTNSNSIVEHHRSRSKTDDRNRRPHISSAYRNRLDTRGDSSLHQYQCKSYTHPYTLTKHFAQHSIRTHCGRQACKMIHLFFI